MISLWNLPKVEGEVFSAPNDFLIAVCVPPDFKTNDVCVKKFKRIYGQVKSFKNRVEVGDVAIIPNKSRRFVFYLILHNHVATKETRLNSLRIALENLRKFMVGSILIKKN